MTRRRSGHYVFESVKTAVARGRERMDLEGITAVGLDEMQRTRGRRVAEDRQEPRGSGS